MKVDYRDLPVSARVWIYQNSQEISDDEQSKILQKMEEFVEQWAAHNQPLAAHAEIRHDRFLLLVVDEGRNMASGCSIDASVHFIRSLEVAHGLDLFDRMTFSYLQNDTVSTVKKSDFARLYSLGEIDDHTLVFDNLVKTKGELESNWLKPLSDSWHKRFVGSMVS